MAKLPCPEHSLHGKSMCDQVGLTVSSSWRCKMHTKGLEVLLYRNLFIVSQPLFSLLGGEIPLCGVCLTLWASPRRSAREEAFWEMEAFDW